MSAVASILTTDDGLNGAGGIQIYTNSATVAANKTYSPEGLVRPGVWRYVDRSVNPAIGYPSYEIEALRPGKGNRNFRFREKIALPIMNTTSPSTGSGIQPLPSVGYTLYCNREWVIPEAALAADRAKLYSLAASFHADTVYASDTSPSSVTGAVIRAAIYTGEVPFG